jgi:hypothetical protein
MPFIACPAPYRVPRAAGFTGKHFTAGKEKPTMPLLIYLA